MNLKLLLLFASFPFALTRGEERPAIYPFDVTVAGQEAVYKDGFPIFAKIPEPVAPDAEVALGIEAEQIIVNVFPCNPDGTVPTGAPAKIIMVGSGTGFKLDATMDKTTLDKGLYGMNIVVGSKGTSRVMFTVGDAAAKPPVVAAADPDDAAAIAAFDALADGDSKPATGRAPNAAADAAAIAAFDALSGGGSDKPQARPAGEVDQSTPESTLAALFAAAKSGDLSPLLTITPASGDIDGDVQQIRDSATADPDLQAKFAKFFADGKVDGEARIDGDKAEVDFFFGPGGTRSETMNLVRKDGKWFLDSF